MADTVLTTRGVLPVSFLDKRTGSDVTENDVAHWTEYWLDEELVHRSVRLEIKRSLFSPASMAGRM